MACTCCLASDSRVIVNDIDISQFVRAVSVDSNQEVLWEDSTNNTCEPIANQKIYLFGPGKTTVQLTAFPFGKNDSDYMMGFRCPVNINVSVPWKWVYDCRKCDDCIGGAEGQKRKGKWMAIAMRKKQVTVTGDIGGSDLFVAEGCELRVPKFSFEAGPHAVTLPQYTTQYSRLRYNGGPMSFDTDNLSTAYTMSVAMNAGCPGFSKVTANLTGFQFNFQPPAPPTVSYTFETMLSVCPICQ